MFSISIGRHQFNISCDKQDESAMSAAAALIEKKIKQLRADHKVADAERAALMAALQIVVEVQKQPAATPMDVDEICHRIDSALAHTDDSLQKRAC